MKEINSNGNFNIVGKGTVYITSLTENNLHINDLNVGDEIIIDNVIHKIREIELARNGFGVAKDDIGILVCNL